MEYRWQVVNLDALTVLAHLDHSGPAPHGEARQSHREAWLDHGGCSAAAALLGRQVQRLHDPGYGGQPPAWRQVWPSARDAAWTTRPWDGHPGDRVAFVVSRERRAWQAVEAVAANPDGVLPRVVSGRGGWFRRSRPEVREVADESLAHAVAQGTFTPWLAYDALALHGMAVVVGRGRRVVAHPDRVSAVLTRPPAAHTFRVVRRWRHPRQGGGGTHQ